MSGFPAGSSRTVDGMHSVRTPRPIAAIGAEPVAGVATRTRSWPPFRGRTLRVETGLGGRFLDAGRLQDTLDDPEPRVQNGRPPGGDGRYPDGCPVNEGADEQAIRALLRAIEHWDPGTGTHVERMSRYARLIAGGAGFDEDRCEVIRLAAQMHDVGKVGLPDAILFKPGRLSPAEFDVVKSHTARGAEILRRCDTAVLGTAAVIARTHHEWWDGAGYPDGLAGQQIPIEGRIAAVADVFDALVSRRVYKPAYTIEQALGALKQGRGHHFDGELVDVFVASMDGVGEIHAAIPPTGSSRPPDDALSKGPDALGRLAGSPWEHLAADPAGTPPPVPGPTGSGLR